MRAELHPSVVVAVVVQRHLAAEELAVGAVPKLAVAVLAVEADPTRVAGVAVELVVGAVPKLAVVELVELVVVGPNPVEAVLVVLVDRAVLVGRAIDRPNRRLGRLGHRLDRTP